MFTKKEFWFAVFFLVLAVISLVSFLSKGFSSYRISGMVIFTFLGIAFLRRAIQQ